MGYVPSCSIYFIYVNAIVYSRFCQLLYYITTGETMVSVIYFPLGRDKYAPAHTTESASGRPGYCSTKVKLGKPMSLLGLLAKPKCG